MQRDVYNYVIPDVPIETLLQVNDVTGVNSQKNPWWQTVQSNFDVRDGNIHIRDATNERIRIGLMPDGTYGFVVTKPGYDVSQVFTAS